MRRTGSIVGIALGVLLATGVPTGRPLALGKPDWAEPLLDLPTPTGPFIARNDRWVMVRGGMEFALIGERSIEQRCRFIFENVSGEEQTFSITLPYDEGVQEMTDLALNVQRRIWHEINVDRSAVRASVTRSAQIILASAEGIEPHKRVVLEYTLRDTLGLLPWHLEFIPRETPVATIRYSVEPESARRGLRLEVRTESSSPLPGTIARADDGSWTVTAVPAEKRLRTLDLAYQVARTDLFPHVLVYTTFPPGDSMAAYARFYREAWEARERNFDHATLAERATALTRDAATAFEKASRIARFVQRDIRYDASNEKSADAWLPLAATETLRSMRADCKGKVMLMQALLRAAGIESAPVLVRWDDDYFEWGREPGTARLNHVVIAVGLPKAADLVPGTLLEGPAKGWVLFDPTVEMDSLGGALPGYEGLPALFVGDAADPVFTVHTVVPSVRSIRVDMQCALSDGGGLEVRLGAQDNGASVLGVKLAATYSTDDARSQIVETLSRAVNQVRVKEFDVKRAGDEGRDRMEYRIHYVAPNPLQEMTGSSLLTSPLAVVATIAGLPNGLRTAAAVKPDDRVELAPPWDAKTNAQGIGRTVDATVALELPPGLDWNVPPPRREAQPWLAYELEWTRTGSRSFAGKLHIVVPRGKWPVEERASRLKLTDELFSGLYSPMLLRKVGPATAAPEPPR